MMTGMTIEERFWAKVQRGGGCWLWTGATAATGYGMFDGRTAHRTSYQLTVGPIEPGLVIDHLCRVRNCVRPDHLEAVGRGENVLRGETITAANAAKTACKAGHPYDEANTYITPRGKRDCRKCRAAASARYYARS